MENLKQLEEFRGRVKNVSDFNWLISLGTCCYCIGVGLKNAYRLGIGLRKLEDLGGKDYELVLYESNVRDEKVLGKDIAHLKIGGCEGLSKCFVDDLASRFDNPTSLRSLYIRRCGGIECIWRSDLHGVGLQASQISETLEEIQLEGLDDLKGVVMMQRGEIGASTIAPAQLLVFSSLKVLYIYNCNKMRKVGLPVSKFPNLESICIWHCGEIEEIFEDDGRDVVATLPKLKELRLSRNPRLRKVGLAASGVPNLEEIFIWDCGEIEEILKEEDEGRAASIVTTLHKFRFLQLKELPRLRSVSNATMICNSIEIMLIKKCPRLMNKLPVDMTVAPPPSLRILRVDREWWESLEWDRPELPRLFQSVLSFY